MSNNICDKCNEAASYVFCIDCLDDRAQGLINALRARAEAAEKERDDAIKAHDKLWEENNSLETRAEAAEKALVAERAKVAYLERLLREQREHTGAANDTNARYRSKVAALEAEGAALREALRCAECGAPATHLRTTEGDGDYWFCDSQDALHDSDRYDYERIRVRITSTAGAVPGMPGSRGVSRSSPPHEAGGETVNNAQP